MKHTERDTTFIARQAGTVGVLPESPAGYVPIRGTPLAEFLAQPRPRSLVRAMFPEGPAYGVGFGPPGSGKTFFTAYAVINLARTDANRPTHLFGHRMTGAPVPVVYISTEGNGGLPDRFRAEIEREGITPADVLLEVIKEPMNLLSAADVDDVLLAIKDIAERIGPARMIVVDTLNGSMQGDENASLDMGLYLAGIKRLAVATGAFVLLIHHSGKNIERGARGHSSLKAAVDIEIELQGDGHGHHSATLQKVRDGQSGEVIGFNLRVVKMGVDEFGEDITTCVVEPADAPIPATGTTRPLSGVARIGLDSLREALQENGETLPETSTIPAGVRAVRLETWRARFALRYGKDDGGKKNDSMTKAHRRAKDQLFERKLIAISDPWVWVTA